MTPATAPPAATSARVEMKASSIARHRARPGDPRAGSSAVAVDVATPSGDWCLALPQVECIVEKAAQAALESSRGESSSAVTVGIVLTDDAEQRRLNRDYRGQDKPTNVLSFALAGPEERPPPGASLLLGDVVLAYETVTREAAEQGKPIADHLQHLVVHGVLHLLGYDHENDTEAAIMEAREGAILRGLGVPDPYRDTI